MSSISSPADGALPWGMVENGAGLMIVGDQKDNGAFFLKTLWANALAIVIDNMAFIAMKVVLLKGFQKTFMDGLLGCNLLGGRRFRPVSFPLALLLLVFFLQPLKGNALTLKCHMLAGIAPMMETPTAQKACQEAGEPGEERDLKNSGIRPDEPKDDGDGDGANDHGNKTDNMFVCHVCDAVLSGTMGLLIGFILGIVVESRDSNIYISMMERHFLLENKEQDK